MPTTLQRRGETWGFRACGIPWQGIEDETEGKRGTPPLPTRSLPSNRHVHTKIQCCAADPSIRPAVGIVYFLITPKFLPDLKYHERIQITLNQHRDVVF
ncbi:hypothetical protein AB1N83_010035 [Pleurotus pulmonarius]